ncbi:MAG: twin-arginine translocase TatA/TatE family subunit [Chloroflexota bacterium]
MHLGPLEIGAILLLVLIIFGAGKLPEVGAALGKGIREFNKSKTGADEETKDKSAKATAETETKVENKTES